ncbi:archaeal proteasome endopeptidase complex subunit beta [Haloarcula onubensis]|uniref:Proteasome subunit beta n=1 Tax=Haloarcula onubensis TaxID=2950539 RepID=A0ABU2FJV6_9EURY|nr:archaeal proteasome endopeptidase complex subunit beta [Halomicroarcula sp. S3CR25-11]MDS0281039.1 archaeal proteasome endopeptidase complex subunit beta [Halomicroarcula sp. S3CR25-11]
MYDPDERLTDAYEPEVGTIPSDSEGRDEENVTKTGTTTVGITTEDGVVVATDRRASLGGRFVSNKSVTKVEQIHPTAAMTLVGSVGGAQSFIRSLRSEANLYEVRRDEPLSIHALATLAGNFARGGPFFAINPIIGGVDEEGTHVYSVDPAGGVLQDDYTVTGSGTMVATGTIEGNYDPEMSLEAARELAIRAVNAAAERDTGSGNGVVIAEITADGVDIDRFDDYASAE